jgi:hypothetical protein
VILRLHLSVDLPFTDVGYSEVAVGLLVPQQVFCCQPKNRLKKFIFQVFTRFKKKRLRFARDFSGAGDVPPGC